MANVIIVTSTVCLILVGASAGSGSLRGTLKTANSSGLVANADVQKEGGVELQDLVDQSADVQKEDNVKFLKLRRESNLPWPFKWPCPKKGPWPQPPGCAEGGGELQDLANQSADVQKEDIVKLTWHIPHKVKQAAKKAWGVAKQVAKYAAGCYISTLGARFDC